MFDALIQKIFGGAAKWLRSFFNSAGVQKAQAAAKTIGALIPLALPVVEIVAKLCDTKNTTNLDERIVDVLRKLSVPVEADLSKPLSKATRDEMLFAAARAMLVGDLEKAVGDAGSYGLKIGGQYVKDTGAISGDMIDSAIQTAYSFYKAAMAAEGK